MGLSLVFPNDTVARVASRDNAGYDWQTTFHLVAQLIGGVGLSKRCDTAWLPDSFGLTGSLPQLIRLAGMKYFFTQKLSWNNMQLTHPLVSPVLQGSLGNLCPLYIIAGDGEVLRDEIIYMAHKAANPSAYPTRQGSIREARRQKENAEKFTTPTKVVANAAEP
ncbi:hypothetical protein BC835DRAFT_1338153 [Cytidiella melzeri]|nr:hypothetical protein BC835DRAFT_1338153 [Cytidiella melzeri]